MSNESIITHIEKRIVELESDSSLTQEFADYLGNSFEALEGIPYKKIQEMRDFQYKVEVSGFHEEEDCISDLPTVISSLKGWLYDIKKNYS